MQTPISSGRNRKRLAIGIISLSILLIVLTAAYELLWNKPVQVDGGIVLPEKIFEGHTSDLWIVRFSPDGTLIANGSVDSFYKPYLSMPTM